MGPALPHRASTTHAYYDQGDGGRKQARGWQPVLRVLGSQRFGWRLSGGPHWVLSRGHRPGGLGCRVWIVDPASGSTLVRPAPLHSLPSRVLGDGRRLHLSQLSRYLCKTRSRRRSRGCLGALSCAATVRGGKQLRAESGRAVGGCGRARWATGGVSHARCRALVAS